MVAWIGYAVAAVAAGALTPVFIKTGAKRTAPTIGAAIFAAVVLLYYGGVLALGNLSPLTALLDGGTAALLALAGACWGFFCLCLFRALSTGPVTRVTPITNASVVLTSLLGVLLFEGALGFWKVIFLLVVVLGTVLLESERGRPRDLLWVLFALLAAAFTTAADTLLTLLETDVPDAAAMFCVVAAALIVVLAFAVIGRSFATVRKMTVGSFLFTLLAGMSAGLSVLCRYYSELSGNWDKLAPLTVLSLPLTLLFARVFLRERLSGANVLGLIFVLCGMFALTMNF